MDRLADAIEADLPGAWIDVDVLVAYSRGDLLSRAHSEGEVIAEEHGPEGTRLKARVPPALAGQLAAAAHA
jgi:GTP-binding protein HflX